MRKIRPQGEKTMKKMFILTAILSLLFIRCSKTDPTPIDNPNADLTGPTKHATGYIKAHEGHGLVKDGIFKNPRTSAYLPVSFDWRSLGFTLPIKNQGSCGSCWAFATIANLESAALIFNSKVRVASEQEIVDCDDAWYGCRGGNFAGPYLIKNGVTSEELYPYKAYDQACKAKKLERILQPVSWYNLGAEDRSPTVDELKAAIMQFGYVSVTVAANARWDMYNGGVMHGCKANNTNHMVNLVGWTADGNWIMRNSWGTSWGDNGYALMPYGCDSIGEEAAYVVVEKELE
jgi:C1A family cysteine protease